MKKKFDKVFQFKITLHGTKPPIWRRIQVPETYTFWDLHVATQDAMGWSDYHLHEFEMLDPKTGEIEKIGTPHEDYSDELIPESKQKIAEWFSMENRRAGYIYDFGDSWEHIIELEKIIPREKNVNYTKCVKGKGACPPEDCGGVWGYENFLKIIKTPNHEEHKEMLEWIGGEFNPERFVMDEVVFDDPDERRKFAFS